MALSTTTETQGYTQTLAAALSTSGDGLYAQGFFTPTKNQIESYSFTKSSATWSAKAVMPATVDVHPASIAFTPNLDGLAVWAETNVGPGIFYNTYTAAGGWSQPVQIDTGSYGGLSAFVSSTGIEWAAWSGSTTGVVRVK